ncbi:DegV family protein [Arthrobacter sp. TMN-37]
MASDALPAAVVTDSAAGFPPGWLDGQGRAGGVTVVPLPVMIAGQIYGDGGDSLVEPLTIALAQGSEVRTSRPSPGQFERAYRALEAEGHPGIISIHLSGALSGTVDAARLAASSVGIPVEVIDSRTAGMPQGYAAVAALQALRQGASLERSAAEAAIVCRTSELYFYVPSLDQLRRGGRISAAAGWLGNVLSVKALLKIQDGRVVPVEKVRTADKALDRLLELVKGAAAARSGGTEITIHHFGNDDEAAGFADRLESGLPGTPVSLARCPAVLAAHAGLGVMAVAVVPRPLSP